MNIRPAHIQDSTALAHIQVDSYRTAYAPFFPQSYLDHFTYKEQAQDWCDLLSAGTDDILLIAELDDGSIAGYALGRPGPTGTPPYDSELLALHVSQPHQRQGIGSQLIAAMATALQHAGCTSLILWTLEGNPARALYQRLGGQGAGEKAWGGNDEFGTDVQEAAYGWPDVATLAKGPNLYTTGPCQSE